MATINHRKVSALPDNPSSDISSGEWNDSLVLRGDGVLGDVLVRDPGAPDGWTLQTPVPAGNVIGPATAIDNRIVRFDGTTGKTIQNSLVTVDDTGYIVPTANNTQDIGSTSLGWRNGYLASSLTTPIVSAPGNLQLNSTGTTIYFQLGGATNYWLDGSGLVVASDNTRDIGSSSVRWRSGYFGTSLSIGTNPAQTGALRLASGTFILWRDAANTMDHVGLFPIANYQLACTGHFVPSSDGGLFLGFPSNRWQGGSYSDYITIGTNTAQSGGLRLANDKPISIRNATNTADLVGVTRAAGPVTSITVTNGIVTAIS